MICLGLTFDSRVRLLPLVQVCTVPFDCAWPRKVNSVYIVVVARISATVRAACKVSFLLSLATVPNRGIDMMNCVLLVNRTLLILTRRCASLPTMNTMLIEVTMIMTGVVPISWQR